MQNKKIQKNIIYYEIYTKSKYTYKIQFMYTLYTSIAGSMVNIIFLRMFYNTSLKL